MVKASQLIVPFWKSIVNPVDARKSLPRMMSYLHVGELNIEASISLICMPLTNSGMVMSCNLTACEVLKVPLAVVVSCFASI